jgi:hypothetical protein
MQMGLWDLDPQLNRIPTPLVEAYRQLTRQGSSVAGRLAIKQFSEDVDE